MQTHARILQIVQTERDERTIPPALSEQVERNRERGLTAIHHVNVHAVREPEAHSVPLCDPGAR